MTQIKFNVKLTDKTKRAFAAAGMESSEDIKEAMVERLQELIDETKTEAGEEDDDGDA